MHALPLLSLLTTAAALPQQLPLSSITKLIPSLTNSDSELCPLAPKVSPPNDGLHDSLHFLHDASVRETQAHRLSRAVQVPTTVSDFMTDPYDEGFEVFVRFQELLKEMFPLVHSRANLEHINRLGLLYTLPGESSSSSSGEEKKKPLLFMAHQDVVPIANAEDWTYPPFSGHYDQETGFIWGRGSSDCKNTLIGLLSVLEDLLSQNFSPSRDVIFAFGFDEESHGFLGAGSLAPFLKSRYGEAGVEFILDEGGMGLVPLGEDTIYALPGVGEKGAIDLRIDLNVSGGHSSIPPSHTGIGVMSQIIYVLEREDLFLPFLGQDHPTRRTLECQARYSADDVESWLGEMLDSDDYVRAAEKVAASRGDMQGVVFRTSQAADMISGGVKVNALPEKVSAVVNYRVALHQTPEDVFARAERIISAIAKEHELEFSSSMTPSAATAGDDAQNHIALAPLTEPLRPAPVSPTSLDSKTWVKFTGVTRAVFEAVFNKTVVVSGDVMTGNTDTRFYWGLSENIYRWSPAVEGGAVNIHTVDERVKLDAHLQGMMVYYDLIRSFDA